MLSLKNAGNFNWAETVETIAMERIRMNNFFMISIFHFSKSKHEERMLIEEANLII